MQSSSYRTCLICGSSYEPFSHRQKFCSDECRRLSRSTIRNDIRATQQIPNGTRRITTKGYATIYLGKGQWKLEHRHVMEQVVGRKLSPREQVHHKDHNKLNNSPDNLELTTLGQHMREHHSGLRWSRNYDACIECGTTERKHCRFGRCWLCDDRLQSSLVPKLWHREGKFDACIKCGLTDHPYYRRGLCHGCKATSVWAKLHTACVSCGTTDRRHMAKGLCISCYGKR